MVSCLCDLQEIIEGVNQVPMGNMEDLHQPPPPPQPPALPQPPPPAAPQGPAQWPPVRRAAPQPAGGPGSGAEEPDADMRQALAGVAATGGQESVAQLQRALDEIKLQDAAAGPASSSARGPDGSWDNGAGPPARRPLAEISAAGGAECAEVLQRALADMRLHDRGSPSPLGNGRRGNGYTGGASGGGAGGRSGGAWPESGSSTHELSADHPWRDALSMHDSEAGPSDRDGTSEASSISPHHRRRRQGPARHRHKKRAAWDEGKFWAGQVTGDNASSGDSSPQSGTPRNGRDVG